MTYICDVVKKAGGIFFICFINKKNSKNEER